MKIITIVGPDTANGRKYSTDITALYNELDKSEMKAIEKRRVLMSVLRRLNR
ncbi:hypothetical protein N5V81_13610 [Escherichia coli]|nr:hypothetical protein [Escherichia coli]